VTADLTLAIEMSNPSCEAGVAIGSRAGGTLGVEPIHTGDGRHDDLMTAIDRLCLRLEVQPGRIGRVAVSRGPGGYTALRIAIATTKMLCESLHAGCVGIPSASVVARRVSTTRPFAVILASKGETAFATVFDTPHSARGAGHLLDASALENLGVADLIADRFLPAPIIEAAQSLGIQIQPPRFDAAACLELSFDLSAIDPAHLAPLYPREPEAVTKWRLRKGQ
jgi:tRNA threonylcarbamoyl adenosine modification protein YeaZ